MYLYLIAILKKRRRYEHLMDNLEEFKENSHKMYAYSREKRSF